MKLSQMIGYAKYFGSNKTLSFKVSDEKLLKKYTKIWERVSNSINTKFNSEPVYGDHDKYINTNIKSYGDKIIQIFKEKIPHESASYKCLSLIVLHSVIRANKKHYPQTHLEECKYEMKNKIILIMDLIMINLMINLLKDKNVI